jgi:hypothetical protein
VPHLEQLDWTAISASLDEFGYAMTPPVLGTAECAQLVSLYADDERFRSRVDMTRYNFGSGEYKYFARPLPDVVEQLREGLYPELAIVANRWGERLGGPSFPARLEEFLAVCSAHGQTRPTPLLLHYGPNDYNCLHQDIYGDVAFPLQATVMLSRVGTDFAGGEFLLLEQRPRAQSRGHSITLEQGQAVIFATRHRPARGSRGFHRLTMRHGVSRLLSGQRYTLGIIFHDAR